MRIKKVKCCIKNQVQQVFEQRIKENDKKKKRSFDTLENISNGYIIDLNISKDK